jgi:hypothetical protein
MPERPQAGGKALGAGSIVGWTRAYPPEDT